MRDIDQLFIGLTEDASAELEAMLAREVCPAHPGTTLDIAGACALCDLDHAQHADAVSALRTQRKPVWVQKAEAGLLVPKVWS